MNTMRWAAAALIILLGSSCSSLQVSSIPKAPVKPTHLTHPPQFTVNEEVYAALKPSQSRIEIFRGTQKFYLKDHQGRVAIETDCSTGVEGKESPLGNFTIKERIASKRSNLYGKYVDKQTGEIVVERSWEVDKAPSGTRFLGTAMPYWMRLTWSGVGIHVGKFPRGYRSSFGCIRMPEEIQPRIFEKCRTGTPVKIFE